MISVDCTIRDLTPFGARIVVTSGAALPRRGWLINVRDGRAHDSLIVWRASGLIGVSFSDTMDLEHATATRQRHLRDLWIACGGREIHRPRR